MRLFTAAVVLAAGALALSGCGGSHKRLVQGQRGAGAARAAFIRRALHAAHSSDHELSIFPIRLGNRKCTIPRALGGVHAPVPGLPGTCRTSFRRIPHGPGAIVTFTQRWKWPPCTTREDCIAAHLRRRTWRITVRPSEDGTPKPLVVATHGTGAQAPQAPKP